MTQQHTVRQSAKWGVRLKSELQKELLAHLGDGKVESAMQVFARLDNLCHSANLRYRSKRVAVQVLVQQGKSEHVLSMLRSVLGDAAVKLALDSYEKHFGDIAAELARFAEPKVRVPRVQVLDRQPSRAGFVRH